MNQPELHATTITSPKNSLSKLLTAASLADLIPKGQPILLKPNLVEALKPPVTTPVQLISLVIEYLQKNIPNSPILIGEGTGSLKYDTFYPFQMLGYTTLAAEKGIPLLDLNNEKLVTRQDSACKRLPTIYLPAILDNVFLLSVPVLKAHTLAGVTLTMKNMMGCVPPSHFRGSGCWAKSAFHEQLHEAIFDLNRYRSPDFTLLDASIGMSQAHLWGAHCDPPVNILAASTDPVAIDAFGASLLNKGWKKIGHICMADKILGTAALTATHIS